MYDLAGVMGVTAMAHTMDSDLTRQLEAWLPPVGDNNFRIWGSNLVPDLGAIWARDHTHDYPPHIHDCVEMIWVHAGCANFICRGMSHQLAAGDVCLIAPNELHHTRVTPGKRCTFTIVHVPSNLYWPVVHDIARKNIYSDLVPLRVVRANAFSLPLAALLEILVHSTDTAEIRAQLIRLVEEALIAPRRCLTSQLERTYWHPAVIYARETMAAAMEEPVNIQDIARQVGLNVRYFISLFKEGTGLSPHQYQIALRVERARNLIQARTPSLCEVAVSAGFSDQSHLNRHFKRSYGYTPGGFRQLLNHISI